MRETAVQQEPTIEPGERKDALLEGEGAAACSRAARVPPRQRGSGHGQEEVPTPQGWRSWGELHVGDVAFGTDGATTVVTDGYERGRLPTFRVRFSDGSALVVDGDHPWCVRQRCGKYAEWRLLTLTTTELLSSNLRAPTFADGRSRGWRFTIPMVDPLQRPSQMLLAEPYTLGALIANGSLTGSSATLTTPDPEVVARVRRHYAVPAWRPSIPGEVCARGSVRGVIAVVRRLGLDVHSADKFIPPMYLRGSVEQRVALLQGLMDGDGADRGPRRASVHYFTASQALTRDIRELVTGLGGTASVRWYTRPGRQPEAVMDLMLPASIELFHSSAKRRGVPRKVTSPRRAIVAVEPFGHRQIRCHSVAASDHLLVVGRDHIVTSGGASRPTSPTTYARTRPC